MAGRATVVWLILLGVALSGVIHWKTRRDLGEAELNHASEVRSEALLARGRIENSFRSIYSGLRTVAHLPGVRALTPESRRSGAFDPGTREIVAEIYKNLAASENIAALTIVPFPFDPNGLDPTGKLPREPLVTFGEKSAVRPGVPGRGSSTSATEIDKFALVLTQLQLLQQFHPLESGIEGIAYPAISGPQVTSRDDARSNRRELVYSVPIYGWSGELSGCASAVIPGTALEQLLPVGEFVVVHPNYAVSILSEEPGTAEESREHWVVGEPDPRRIFSEVVPLAIQDEYPEWSLWLSAPNSEYWARSDVRLARFAGIASHLFLWCGIMFLLFTLRKFTGQHLKLTVENRELDERVRERTEACDEASRLAQSATEAKSVFLAKMSHEIRTPMSAILGFTDLLLDPETEEGRRNDAIETIRRNGRHLLNLINDILDLSKIEAGRLEIERLPVKTRTIVRDMVDLLRVRAESRHTTLDTELRGEIPEQFETDPTRLKQALVNLIGNAIKFTEGGDVRVRVECDRDAEQITFHVIDNGIGMTSAQVARIFQPFSQAEPSTTRRFGGTGLGLAITRSIAELLDGEIVVQSEPGKGSTFSLTVSTGSLDGVANLSELGEERFQPEPRPEVLAHIDGRVLLVEDGPDNQAIISYMLRRAGAEVMLASNGREGGELALAASRARRPFDVILMDMEMPVLDGYEATRWLREEGYQGQVIALTAHAMKGDLDKCLAAGCDHYMSKPVEREDLVREVAHRVGLRSTAKPAPVY